MEKLRYVENDYIHVEKADLHTHLAGSLTMQDISDIARKCGLDFFDLDNLLTNFNYHNNRYFQVTKAITSHPIGLQESIKRFILKSAKDGVKHTEVTINFAGILRRGTTDKEILTSIDNAINEGDREGISGKIKFGINRKDGPDSIDPVLRLYRTFPENLVAGFDLNGDERRYPTYPFIQAFKAVKRKGIPITIHAGEYADLEESLEHALQMKPDRIGHALAAAKREDLLDYMAKENIIVEGCPSSSIGTGAICSLYEYPIHQFLSHDTPYILGSDDIALFNNSLSIEYRNLQKLQVKQEQLNEIAKRSLRIAF